MADAGHLNCNQIRGTMGSEVRYGTDACDEFTMYAGADSVYGYGGHDYARMGSYADIARMGSGIDTLYGDDNDLTSQEVLKTGTYTDYLYEDNTGSDWDLLCGGEQQDFFDTIDGDGKDDVYGDYVEDKEDICHCSGDAFHADTVCPIRDE